MSDEKNQADKEYFASHEYLPIGGGTTKIISVAVLLDAIDQDRERDLPEWVKRMIYWKLIAFGRGFALMEDGRGLSDDYLMYEGHDVQHGPEAAWLVDHARFISAKEFENFRRVA